jgi:hypothetical protein
VFEWFDTELHAAYLVREATRKEFPLGSSERKEATSLYYKTESALINRLSDEMAKEEGLTGNPKAKMLFDKAWEEGHAYGINEIWSHYVDLADLIRPEKEIAEHAD